MTEVEVQEKPMDAYSEMKIKAMETAAAFLKEIVEASHNPSKKISGEALKVYNELVEWDWLEHYPIEDEKNRWLYLTMIAQTQYRHLKWEHEHPKPQKQELTKWERVVGRAKP